MRNLLFPKIEPKFFRTFTENSTVSLYIVQGKEGGGGGWWGRGMVGEGEGGGGREGASMKGAK